MKPDFALSLSFDGIVLLQRAFPGWARIGEVALDDEDLPGALRALRDKATAPGNEPGSGALLCKLVVPNDQVRYFRIDAPQQPGSDISDQVRRKLTGATPYGLDDLAYDWSETEGRILIAAVARETLREAEAFAVEHRFDPVSFVALPEAGSFAGEPFFGQTEHAAGILGPEQSVARDTAPIRVIGHPAGSTPEATAPVSAEPVTGFAEPAATFTPASRAERSAPEIKEPPAPISVPISAPAQSQATFTSMRAQRDPTPETGPRLDGVKRQAPPVHAMDDAIAQDAPADPEGEETGMAIFGAREDKAIGGKPRYLGIVLTLLLLLFMAAVALWASLFLDDETTWFFGDRSAPDIAALPPRPDHEITAINDVVAPAAMSDLAAPPAGAPPHHSETIREDVARARYAATGIWMTPAVMQNAPMPGALENFHQASIDTPVTIKDAVALPAVLELAADTPIAAPVIPARSEGTLSPKGVMIFSGRPPSTPPALPERLRTTKPPGATSPQPAAEPPLAALRPKSRPGTPPEQKNPDEISGPARNELAVLRPKARPASQLQPPAEPAPQDNAQTQPQPFIDLDAVNKAVTEAVQTEPPAKVEKALPQAVASSLKPNTRPKNLNARVEQKVQPKTTKLAVSPSQKMTPIVPTARSVAKQATQRNALKLRSVNLIGVYGSAKNRRALVRMSNGRYRKVKVGDRLDGGKVMAIGASELRYHKSGRNVILKMPKG